MKGFKDFFRLGDSGNANNKTPEKSKPSKIEKINSTEGIVIPLKNDIAEINTQESELNKYGSMEKIENEWVPKSIEDYITDNNLKDHPKAGMLRSEMAGKSHVMREINTGDNNNRAKTEDAIKAITYDVLDTFCRKENIYRDKAA